MFGSPIRRARQLGAGSGVIVDCDDGNYEIVVDVDPGGNETTPASTLRETFFSVDLFLKVTSGIVTVCDIMCLLHPKSVVAGGSEWLVPLHFVRASISPGTYQVRLLGYSRAAAAGDEKTSRRVFTEEDHAACWEATRRSLFGGDLSKAEYEAVKARLESRAVFVVDGIAYSFVPVAAIPAEYDPGDMKLDLAPKQMANKLLERRAGPK